MKIIKLAQWLLLRKQVKHNLLQFCKLEYREADVPFAYNRLYSIYKNKFFGV